MKKQNIDIQALYQSGLNLMQLKQYDEAFVLFLQVDELLFSPFTEDEQGALKYFYYDFGRLYKLKGQHANAIKAFKQGIRCNDSLSPLFYQEIGKIFAFNRQFDEAIHYFKKTLERDSENEHAYYFCGIAYYSKQDYKKALVYISEALRWDDQFTTAYLYRFYIYKHLDDVKNVLLDFMHYQRLNPQTHVLVHEVCSILNGMKASKKAVSKKLIFDVVKILPHGEAQKYLKQCLDQKTELGKIMEAWEFPYFFGDDIVSQISTYLNQIAPPSLKIEPHPEPLMNPGKEEIEDIELELYPKH
jgi:tetratricopeptide (TPR) repeat protein